MNKKVSKVVNVLINILYGAIFLSCFCGIIYLGRTIYSQIAEQNHSDKNIEASIKSFGEDAATYYEEKYGSRLNVKNSGSIYIEGISNTETGDLYIETEEGDAIIYIEEKNQIYDDRQAKDIEKKLNDEVWKNIIDMAADTCGMAKDRVIMKEASFNYYGNGKNVEGNFYHELYEEDKGIDEFILRENISITGAELYVKCEKSFDMEKFIKSLSDEIREQFSGYDESEIEVCFLSEDCYQRYLEGEYRKPDIDMNDCYARYIIGKKNYSYIQNYIKAANGIYITSAERDFILSEGDIIFEEEKNIDENELNKIMKDNYDKYMLSRKEEDISKNDDAQEKNSKENHSYSQVILRTPVYQLKYSDRINEYMESKTYKEINVYIKLVPEEIGVEGALKTEINDEVIKLSDSNQFINDTLNHYIEAGKEATDEQKQKLWQVCKLYYLAGGKNGDSYRCKDIYAEMSDAERAVIKSDVQNYYFAGYELEAE